MRWPPEWRDAAALDLLQGTPIHYLLVQDADGNKKIIQRAREVGMATCDADHPPAGVAIVKGEWPGVRMSQGQGDATGGPTGARWIDSNGWMIRLMRAQGSDAAVWINPEPLKKNDVVPVWRHLLGVADSAAHGGKWVLSLDGDLASGLAARTDAALDAWKQLTAAMAFFNSHSEWSGWRTDAVLSVVSSFSGADEFFSREILNLIARTNVSYGIVPLAALRPQLLAGLRAVVYPDARAPAAAVREALLAFAGKGGLLITGPKFGAVPGEAQCEHPNGRYEMRKVGSGKIALAHKQPEDPYELAHDAQILLSHRYDLVRFFNGFLFGAYSTVSPDGKRRMAHVLNYGGEADAENPPSVRLAGKFRSARLWTLEGRAPQTLQMMPQNEAIEVHLPPLAVYGSIELEA